MTKSNPVPNADAVVAVLKRYPGITANMDLSEHSPLVIELAMAIQSLQPQTDETNHHICRTGVGTLPLESPSDITHPTLSKGTEELREHLSDNIYVELLNAGIAKDLARGRADEVAASFMQFVEAYAHSKVEEAEQQARADALYEAADLVAGHPRLYKLIMTRRTAVIFSLTQLKTPNNRTEQPSKGGE